MEYIHQILIILHVITAAAWFGLGLRLAGQARTVTDADSSVGLALQQDGWRTVKIMDVMIVLTIVFSYANFFWGGGFTAYTTPFHISLTLILVLAAIHFFVIRSGWAQLGTAIENRTRDLMSSARKKVAIGTGIGHLLWLILLVLMFWRRF